MSNIDNIPGMRQAGRMISGEMPRNWPVVTQVDTSLAERQAEKAEFYRDMLREDGEDV